MKIFDTIKLVVLSGAALIALTLLTVDKPVKIEKKVIDIKNLPKTVELIGYDDLDFNTNSIIKKGTIIFVGNHESIILGNILQQKLNLPTGKFVIVSNISDAPWFIKRWQAHTKNVKLKGKKQTPWIYDRDGAIRNFLQLPTSDPLKYFIYFVKNDGVIEMIYIGKVKKGSIDDPTIKNDTAEVEKIIKGKLTK